MAKKNKIETRYKRKEFEKKQKEKKEAEKEAQINKAFFEMTKDW